MKGYTYQQVMELRRGWAPRENETLVLCLAEPPATPALQRSVSETQDDNGFHFQRCGGGYRVIRKRIGNG